MFGALILLPLAYQYVFVLPTLHPKEEWSHASSHHYETHSTCTHVCHQCLTFWATPTFNNDEPTLKMSPPLLCTKVHPRPALPQHNTHMQHVLHWMTFVIHPFGFTLPDNNPLKPSMINIGFGTPLLLKTHGNLSLNLIVTLRTSNRHFFSLPYVYCSITPKNISTRFCHSRDACKVVTFKTMFHIPFFHKKLKFRTH